MPVVENKTFLVVDAARAHESSVHALNHFNPEMISLYKGTAQEEYESIAPYLFSLSTNKEFQHLIQKSGWGKAWIIQAVAPVTFEEIQKHFRRFLIVKTEEGKQLLFRFYDPRVLRIFLPSCSAEQLKDFFGPIRYFIAEDEDPSFCLKYSVQNQELKTERLSAQEWFDHINTGNTDDRIKSTSSSSSASDTSNTNTTNPNRNQPPPIHSPWID